MLSHISATDAARNFSDLINRIHYRGEEFIIERGGQPVCRLTPAMPAGSSGADLKKVFLTIPKPDADYWDIVADAVRTQALVPDLHGHTD